jgi:DNA-binding response OmpR family regulator
MLSLSMHVLVVDDDEGVRTLLQQQLRSHLFSVEVAADGTQGSYLARSKSYDVILLDNMLPEKTGLQVCEEIRKSGRTTPIIILSALTTLWQKINLLNAGADDYIEKPFVFEEILARIHAVLRRPHELQREVLSIDDLVMSTTSQKVERSDVPVHLTQKEFLLLEYLMRNEGIVLSRSMILEHVWDHAKDHFSNTIESHIKSLRRKIDIPGTQKLIHTVSGRGYMVDRYI